VDHLREQAGWQPRRGKEVRQRGWICALAAAVVNPPCACCHLAPEGVLRRDASERCQENTISVPTPLTRSLLRRDQLLRLHPPSAAAAAVLGDAAKQQLGQLRGSQRAVDSPAARLLWGEPQLLQGQDVPAAAALTDAVPAAASGASVAAAGEHASRTRAANGRGACAAAKQGRAVFPRA
jgi:hypothetical protein